MWGVAWFLTSCEQYYFALWLHESICECGLLNTYLFQFLNEQDMSDFKVALSPSTLVKKKIDSQKDLKTDSPGFTYLFHLEISSLMFDY